jgi:hypothetical protein
MAANMATARGSFAWGGLRLLALIVWEIILNYMVKQATKTQPRPEWMRAGLAPTSFPEM